MPFFEPFLRYSTLLGLTTGILYAQTLWCRRIFPSECGLIQILAAILLTLIQIIWTQTLLGFLGFLSLPRLLLLNSLIAAVLLSTLKLFFPGSRDATRQTNLLKTAEKIWNIPNIILLSAITFLSVWSLAAVYFLPPRGVDDLVYHLPPIFEYIQTQRIHLLPLSLRFLFAFPQNAEMLFMWPVIFTQSQQGVELVSFLIIIPGMMTVYALARLIKLEPATAVFVTFLFFLSPLILAQFGTCYIDLITNVFFLTLLYFVSRWHLKGGLAYLYLCALGMGTLLGMKYNMLILVGGLQFFIFPRLLNKETRRRHFWGYLALMLGLGSLWYLRNAILLGDPFYPIFSQPQNPYLQLHNFSLLNFLKDNLHKLFLLYITDTGLGGVEGGFGIAALALGLPSWIYVFSRAVQKHKEDGRWAILFWGQVLVGTGMLLLLPLKDIPFYPRLNIFSLALLLLSFGKVLEIFKKNIIFTRSLTGIAVTASILSTVLFFQLRFPTNDLRLAVEDFIKGDLPSENRYFQCSVWDYPDLHYAWEALDELTSDQNPGLSVYHAIEYYTFSTSPAYGRHLQNSIWNFKTDAKEPDAYLFHYSPPEKTLHYVRRKIDLPEVLLNPANILITQTNFTFLFVTNQFLKKEGRSARLAAYYARAFPEIIATARHLQKTFTEGIPVIASSPIGYGLKFLELTNALKNPVYLTVPQSENAYVRETLVNPKRIYSIGVFLEGYEHQKFEVETPNTKITIYENFLRPS